MTTSQDRNEHRVETRLSLQETIFIEVLASDVSTPGSVIMCNSLDLSANGLQVVLDEEITSGSIFRLCIDMQQNDPIFLVGEVKWKRPDPDGEGFRIGFLQFESDDTDTARWKRLVADMLEGKIVRPQ